jgi:hypothetical protein
MFDNVDEGGWPRDAPLSLEGRLAALYLAVDGDGDVIWRGAPG